MDFKDSSDVTIPKEDIPNFLNNYFAKIAEKTSNPNNVFYGNRNNDVHVNFDFEPPTLIQLDYIIKEYSDVCLVACND